MFEKNDAPDAKRGGFSSNEANKVFSTSGVVTNRDVPILPRDLPEGYCCAETGGINAVEINGRWLTLNEITQGVIRGDERDLGRSTSSCTRHSRPSRERR